MSDRLLSEISSNLKRLRTAKGLSQEMAAERSGLSRKAFSDIENGKSMPRVSTLQAIAQVLGVRLPELFVPALTLQHIRFRSKKNLRSRDQIISEVAQWLRNYSELEELLSDKRPYHLRDLGDGLTPVDAAHRVREKLGLSQAEVIRDLSGLLGAAGIKVFQTKKTSDDFWGLSVAPSEGGPAIVVNCWDRIPVERVIFSAAHELGHLILHLHDYKTETSLEDEASEKAANEFAAEFLMPGDVFQKEWDEARGLGLVERVLKIKRIFHVSYKTVLAKLAPEWKGWSNIWIQFNVEYKKKTGRSLSAKEEPDAFERTTEPCALTQFDFQEDRLPRLVRKAIEAEEISMGRGAEILNISVAEMRSLANSWVG